MNRSLRGWITAIGLVSCLLGGGLVSPVMGDDAPAASKQETAEKPAEKPADPPAGSTPAEQPASVKSDVGEAAAEKADAEKAEAEKPAETQPNKDAPHTEQPAGEKQDAAPAAQGEAAHGGTAHGEGGHGHHDPSDLSHANDGPGNANLAPRSLTGIQELKADLAIYTFVVFLLLLGVLLKFGWKPIMAGLDKREQSIRDLIVQAERNAALAQASLKQHQEKLAAAADEAREVLGQARREAEQTREAILAEARSAAQRERDRALEDIAAAKNVALREIAQTSVNTAVGLASRILQREVSAADHSQLIQEALDQFPSRN